MMGSIYNFNMVAGTYDDFYKTKTGKKIDTEEKQCVKKFLDTIPKGEILELGSGTGHWSKWLSEQGFEVLGIDISEKMLEKAKEKNIPNSTFKAMNMFDLNFDDNSKDAIIAITSLEFSTDPDKTFSEIKRVLKPEGHFIAAVLNSKSIIGINKKDNPTFANANFFSLDGLKKRLQKIGTPKFCKAAYLNENFEITADDKNTEPAMIVGFVKNNQ
ncbi:MAG: class I SAM-dependent methyltransferase [Bacteroidota bacterium]